MMQEPESPTQAPETPDKTDSLSELTVLPSGLSGEIREIDVGDENVLADRKLVRSGRNVQKIFRDCWLRTEDPSIYDFKDGKLDPDQLLQGDSLSLLVHLRMESQTDPETGEPAPYDFDVNCPRCGVRIAWTIDFKEFLEENTKRLPAESKRIILEEGGIFASKFPKCGRPYRFKLLRGKDERRFPAIRRRDSDRLSSKLIEMSLIDVEGIKNKSAFLKIDKYPKDAPEKPILSSSDANWFRRHSDEVNCGLETKFDIECMDCGEVPVELPFLESFLLPEIARR